MQQVRQLDIAQVMVSDMIPSLGVKKAAPPNAPDNLAAGLEGLCVPAPKTAWVLGLKSRVVVDTRFCPGGPVT
jgi:hypothetical protein